MSIKYTPDHEWLSVDGDVATVGITHHAQDALGVVPPGEAHHVLGRVLVPADALHREVTGAGAVTLNTPARSPRTSSSSRKERASRESESGYCTGSDATMSLRSAGSVGA